jgi:hypothetical protein
MDTSRQWTLPTLRHELLQTPLFKDCADNEIVSKTLAWEGKVVCRNRSKLLTALALALLEYFEMESLIKAPSPELLQQTDAALWHVVSMAYAFLTLRKKRLLSESASSQTRYVSSKRLLDAAALLTEVVESLTLDDYARLQTSLRGDRDLLTLVESMQKVFTAHGPLRKLFSQQANYFAIATVLVQFGIEDGTPATVAERIGKRRQRATNPLPD